VKDSALHRKVVLDSKGAEGSNAECASNTTVSLFTTLKLLG
jgi:hypothetical protein